MEVRKKTMEMKKCIQCGGTLERIRMKKAWLCPFCGARYEDEAQEKTAAPEGYFGLNEEVFLVEKDLSKVMKDNGGAGCVRSIVYCMDTFENTAQVEEYMVKKVSFSDDISVKGVREDQIEKAMPLIQTVTDPGERVIVYGNKGILSKGKEYFAVTDRRTVFVKKKNIKSVLHADIASLQFLDCGNCYVNGDYDKGIVNLDGRGTFQGALIALICMFALEADPDREKIRIS